MSKSKKAIKLSKADQKKLLKVALVVTAAWFVLTMPKILIAAVMFAAGAIWQAKKAQKAAKPTVSSRAVAAWRAATQAEVTAAPSRPTLVKN